MSAILQFLDGWACAYCIALTPWGLGFMAGLVSGPLAVVVVVRGWRKRRAT